MEDRVLYSSFNIQILEKIRRIAPHAAIAIIHSSYTEEKLTELLQKAHDIHAEYLNLRYSGVTQDHINRIHAANLKVNVWTIDLPFIMIKYIHK